MFRMIPLSAWGAARLLDESSARRLVEDRRIPGARRSGQHWLVPEHAPVVAAPGQDIGAVTGPTPGQVRAREIVSAFVPRWVAEGRPDYSGSALRTPRGLIQPLRQRLTSDPVMARDEVTAYDLDHPGISRAYLELLTSEARRQGKVRVEHTEVKLSLSRVVDVPRMGHLDRLLGDKYDSTLGNMLVAAEQLSQGQVPQLVGTGVDVTVFPASGILYVNHNGAHRSLATLLLGLTTLRVSRATVVEMPLNPALNRAAVLAELLLLGRKPLTLAESDPPMLLELAARLDREDDPRAARVTDLLAKYLEAHPSETLTPGELLGHVEALTDYLALLRRRRLRTWLHKTVRHPWVSEWTLPMAVSPAALWCRQQLAGGALPEV